jgi:hypothetical protein
MTMKLGDMLPGKRVRRRKRERDSVVDRLTCGIAKVGNDWSARRSFAPADARENG